MSYLDRVFENSSEVVVIPSTQVIKFTEGSLKIGEASVAGESAVKLKEVLFTEEGAGVYTGSITLPAGSRIIDIGVEAMALWDAVTSASMVVGDAATADGFFAATDVKATDLLVGETNNIEHPGGKAGAYIASEQRVLYSVTARVITGTITSVGAGTAGRTRMYVCYATPVTTAASFVAA